jgi:gas vesicle protein
MTKKNKSDKRRGRIRFTACVLVFLCALFVWWEVVHTEQIMRDELLNHTQLVADAVNPERIKALSGTEADLNNPHYIRLKEQLFAIAHRNEYFRFIYLVGMKTDGTLFYFADSELNRSDDESPAGMIYDDAQGGVRSVFERSTPIVEGPLTDHWGTWVSGLEPLHDPLTGRVLAVVGIDIDARTWATERASRAALPIGLGLLLLTVILTVLLSVQPQEEEAKPILKQLFFPLSLILALLFAGAISLLWVQYKSDTNERILALNKIILSDFKLDLKIQSSGLALAIQAIALDARVHTALREGDTQRLLSDWQVLFEKMCSEQNITHFYFFDRTRVCLLRLHKPDKKGDIINRFTALQAEKTGKLASGIELGPLGMFTLRVVQPVFHEGELLGYVEIGKEIEDIFDSLEKRIDSHIAVSLHKKYLVREEWESGMRLLGREPHWEEMPHSVIGYASHGRLAEAFLPMADHDPAKGHESVDTDKDVFCDGKVWRVSVSPIYDASGQNVACLLTMADITHKRAAFQRAIVLGGVCSGILLCALLGFVFALLRRTDNGIRLQQTKIAAANQQLKASNQQLRATNQQLEANEQQLRAANQALRAREEQLIAGEHELKKKMEELKNINSLMKDREARVIEMKKEINALLRAQGKPEKYSQGLG